MQVSGAESSDTVIMTQHFDNDEAGAERAAARLRERLDSAIANLLPFDTPAGSFAVRATDIDGRYRLVDATGATRVAVWMVTAPGELHVVLSDEAGSQEERHHA